MLKLVTFNTRCPVVTDGTNYLPNRILDYILTDAQGRYDVQSWHECIFTGGIQPARFTWDNVPLQHTHVFNRNFPATTKKSRSAKADREWECGSDLLSRAVSSQVPSAC